MYRNQIQLHPYTLKDKHKITHIHPQIEQQQKENDLNNSKIKEGSLIWDTVFKSLVLTALSVIS